METEQAKHQAEIQLESIVTLMRKLRIAREKGFDRVVERLETEIAEDPLEIEVRSDWHTPGQGNEKATEYKILLCTGGPAVQITGDLDDSSEPTSAYLQYQDWGTPWINLPLSKEQETALRAYAQQFYWGE